MARPLARAQMAGTLPLTEGIVYLVIVVRFADVAVCAVTNGLDGDAIPREFLLEPTELNSDAYGRRNSAPRVRESF